MTTLKVGDKVKVLELSGAFKEYSGEFGTVTEVVESAHDCIFVRPFDFDVSLPLFVTEVEKLTKPEFKQGSKVAFKLPGWEKAEGVITHVDEKRAYDPEAYAYTVRITKVPWNTPHQIGYITYWRSKMLTTDLPGTKFKSGDRVTVEVEHGKDWRGINGLSGKIASVWSRGEYSATVYYVKLDTQTASRLISEKELKAEVKTKFKVGDKVYVHDEYEGKIWKGRTGVVSKIGEPLSVGPTYEVKFDYSGMDHLIAESSLELQPEVEFEVGDKVRFTSNDHWNDGEGVVRAIDFTKKWDGYFQVEITKKPKLNTIYKQGDKVSLTEREIAKIDRLSTDPFTVEELNDAPLGKLFVDADGDLWVHLGFGSYAFKNSKDELELQTSESLIDNYAPITESNK